MPESDLRAFLRVFMPEERIEAALDSIALMGLEIEATEPLELFVLAHMELDDDPRVTVEAEAVVLMEEVGLDVDQVAAILGMESEEVTDAVERAWAAMDEPESEPEPEPASEPAVEPEPASEPEPAVEPEAEPEPEPAPDPEPESAPEPDVVAESPNAETPNPDSTEELTVAVADLPGVAVAPPRRPVGLMVGGLVALVAVVFLAISVFSPEGRLRVQAQGMDPVIALSVLVLLLLGGWSFLRATEPDTTNEQALDEDAATAADPSAEPATPSS